MVEFLEWNGVIWRFGNGNTANGEINISHTNMGSRFQSLIIG